MKPHHCRPEAMIENRLNGSLEISKKTVNGQQSSVKKRDRISQDYELLKESLEKSCQLELAIVRLHLTGAMRIDRLEKLEREHADKLKDLELAHQTAKNAIEYDTESFMEKVDGHSFEGNGCHDDSFDAIDNACHQSTDPNGRRCVNEVENGRAEVSQTEAATQALGSKSTSEAASLHPEENNETANSRSTAGSTEGASTAEVELDGGAASARNNPEDVLPGNTSLEEIDLDKEMSGEAEKDTMHGLSPPASSGEGITSHDVLISRASDVEVLSDNARAAGNDMESPSSETAPHQTIKFLSVEVPQSTEDRNRDGSEVLVSPEPVRVSLGNVSPSHCLEGMVSENLRSDACEDAQIRDVHREVTCRGEFPSSSAPGSFPEVPPMPTDKDGSGQNQDQQNNLQEAEPEGLNSLNHISSDRGVAQMQPVVQPQISEDALSPTGPLNIPLADGIEIRLHQDALISLQVETGERDSHMMATQTSAQPIARSAIDSLGTGGGHVGSSQLPSARTIPPQPLVQGSAERHLPDPFLIELEKIKREVEHNDQTCADLIARLKSECEREIQEIVAQIRAKYDIKLKETEAAHKLKKNDLGSYKDMVCMHGKLAEAFRISASGLQLQQGGLPVNAPRQSFDLLSLAGGSQTPSLSASSRSLPSNTSPDSSATLIRPRSTHPMAINSQNDTPALMPVNCASSHYPSLASRPLINPVMPARNMMAPIRISPPHMPHFWPQTGPTSLESYLAGNLTNQRMNLAGNVSSRPTLHIPNQVLLPQGAVRPWVRDSVPGSGGSADYVLLSDDD